MESGERLSEFQKLLAAIGGAALWRGVRWLYDHRRDRTKKAIATRLCILEKQHSNHDDRIASLEFILHHRPRAPNNPSDES